MSQPKPVEQVAQERLLVPLYGVDKAKQIMTYVADFLQYAKNFEGDITANFYEAQGRKWLLIACPIVLAGGGGSAATPLSIGVAFPPLFPQKWPYCVINDIGARKLQPDHPYVAANGVIRVQSLPLVHDWASADVPPLIQIIVSIQAGLSDKFPFATVALPPAATSPTAAVQRPVPAPLTPHATATASAAADASTTQGQPSPSAAAAAVLAAASPHRAKLLRAAAESLHQHLLTQHDAHLDHRAEFLRCHSYLTASRDALQAAEAALADKQRRLAEADGPIRAAEAQAVQWRDRYLLPAAATGGAAGTPLLDPQEVITGTDAVNRQALRLQAEVHSYDDAFDVLERSLKKGQLAVDEYLRDVSDLARLQFTAAFQLERTVARLGGSGAGSSGAAAGGGVMHPAASAASAGQSPATPVVPALPAQQPAATPATRAQQLHSLNQQFSSLGAQCVEDVFINAESNYQTALLHLRAMSS